MVHDFGNQKLLTPVVVRMFPEDEKRLKEIVAGNKQYESVSHAIRCAIQAFIRKWGDV